MKKYSLYLFDFDGTLFNTENALRFIFHDAFLASGIEIKNDEIMEISRKPLPETYEKYKGNLDGYRDFINYVHNLVHSERSINETQCFRETKEFLNALKSRNILSGVVTSNNCNHVRNILKHFNIPVDTFSAYVGNGETKKVKPDPTPIQLAIEMSGFKGSLDEIVYVGDGINDTLAANNAGVDAILIDRNNEFPNYKGTKIKSLLELL